MTNVRFCAACGLAALVVVLSCSGPNEPEPAGPAAVISIDTVTGIPGHRIAVPIRIAYPNNGWESFDSIGIINLNIEYDNDILTAIDRIERGDAISDWAGFNAVVYPNEQCEGCPAHIDLSAVRRHSVRDSASNMQAFPEGVIATLFFEAKAPFGPYGVAGEVWFGARGCTSNSLRRLDDWYLTYTADSTFDGCDPRSAVDTIRCPRIVQFVPILSFRSGWVSIAEPNTDVSPGDINGNGIPYEINDAVLFTNQFPFRYTDPVTQSDSLSLFAGDCNRDGLSYTIADLQFLLNIITGDATLADTLIASDGDTLWMAFQQRPDTVLVFSRSTSPAVSMWLELLGDWAPDVRVEHVMESNQDLSVKHSGDTLGIVIASQPFDETDPRLRPIVRIVSSGLSSLRISDLQASAYPGIMMIVNEVAPPPPGITVTIPNVRANPGSDVSVAITLWPDPVMPLLPLSGMDWLIQYDSDALTPIGAECGSAIQDWEYFTWRVGRSDPPYAVRIVSIWDMNNGVRPPQGSEYVEGEIATLRFSVSGDESLVGSASPLRFVLYDCRDNVASSEDGNTLYIPDVGTGDPIVSGGFQPDTCHVPDAVAAPNITLWGGSIRISE